MIVLEADYFKWAIRAASANYVNEMEKQARDKSTANQQASQTKVPNWVG